MKKLSKQHFGLLILMLSFSIFGLIMIFSASSVAAVLRYQVSSNYFFMKQLLFTVIGYIIGIIILFIPTNKYRYISKITMAVMIFLLMFLFIAGTVSGGALSWYGFGLFNFQPAEFIKPVLIIYLAVAFNKLSSKKNITFLNLLIPIIPAVVTFILIALQPDFGSAFIIFVITALIFFSLPFAKKEKKKMYLIASSAGIIALVAIFLFSGSIFQSYQVKRIFNFQKPCERYSEQTGYQVCNGYIAIKNGGLFGVGLGESTQKYLYLPEAHTDFIFPIICEELGVIVGILVLALYFIMLYIILGIAKEADNIRNSILAYGVFTYLLAHILINILGVLGLIPLTGVPLPFLSYGGSFNLCVIVSLFIVQRVNIENKLDKQRRKLENL